MIVMASPPSPHLSPTSNELPSAKSLAMARQLLTPEEPLMESFGSTLPPMQLTTAPLSPVSPAFRPIESASSERGFSPRDPPLYPDRNTTEAVNKPLFGAHTATQRDSLSPVPSGRHTSPIPPVKPRITSTNSSPVALFNDYGMDYWRHCMAEIDSYRANQLLPLPERNTQKRDKFTSNQLSRLDTVIGESRVAKPRNVTRLTTRPKAAVTTPSTVRSIRSESPAKRSHRRKAATPDGNATSADAKPRTRAPATKKKDGPTADAWYQVEDFCPPIDSLDRLGMGLVLPEWKSSGNNPVRPLDLSNDPDRAHLDRRELELASALRLQCNLYLLCKRRIFAAKLQWLKDAKAGKDIKGEFNKTAAQTVCTIDVNKVSKLWTAFNRVGWFEEHWYEKWL